ncbi:MAG TPA: hypothetical protein VGD21_01995 [Lysobacter sp.]
MLRRIFPAMIDNRLRGHVLALWLFVPLALMKVALGLVHILRADGGAQSVSTMPLDTYPAGAAQNIVGLMARMGLEQLLLGLVFVVVLLRYRALIPLMYAVAVLHYLGHTAIVAMKPLVLAGTSGAGTVHLVIAAISVVGLVLSLSGRGYRA